MKNSKNTTGKGSDKKNEHKGSFKSAKAVPQVKDFTYEEFKKTADKTPFTQTEWAAIFHLSERTLQRYAKSNGKFAPIHAERFHQVLNLLNMGKKVFGKIIYFYDWLHSNPPMADADLSIDSLTSFDGIQKINTQLGRIEHGILA